VLSGYLALGVGIERELLIECQNYVRPAFISAVHGGDPTQQTLLRVPDVPGFEVGDQVTVGGIYDSEVAGHCLGWWDWKPVRVELPGTFPQLDIIVQFSHLVTLAINSTSATGRTAELDIPRGAAIGSVNGNPITAGCRLLVSNGRLIARATAPAKRPVTAWAPQ
jgi:hypothetical protein